MENLQSTNKQKKDKSHKDTTYFSERSSSYLLNMYIIHTICIIHIY